jgi:hypothetical protein
MEKEIFGFLVELTPPKPSTKAPRKICFVGNDSGREKSVIL